MRRLTLLFVAGLLGLGVAPALGAQPKTLDIGANQSVWFEEDHTVPMVAVSVSLPAGSAYDPPAKAGLAALAAYLFNEGAGNLNSTAYQDELARRAIQLNLSPDRDYFTLSFVTLSTNLKDAFRLIGLALQRPRFDGDAIARVRAQMLQSLQQEGEDPEAMASRRFYELFFAGHPYGHEVGGTAQGLGAITAADLKGFAKTHWVRGGVKIAVSGDTDSVTLTSLLKSAFGPLPATTPPAPPRVQRSSAPSLTTVAMAVPQSTAQFGLPGILRNDRDYLAGYVANYIVGGGDFSSRLTNEVREKRGLTYGISTSFGTFRGGGYIIGQVATKRESMSESLAVVRDVLRSYAQDGPTADELADAKTYLTGSYPLAFSSNSGIAAQLNSFQRDGLPIEYVARRNSLINALTLDDVRRAARRLFNPARLTIVVAGAPPVAKKSGKPSKTATPR
ncbi:MAG TPA: pitrilysin family protein [Rhizomicrobium sp.]|nr:pitrilysin family protein [Rhizomicrobium sp.]